MEWILDQIYGPEKRMVYGVKYGRMTVKTKIQGEHLRLFGIILQAM